VEGTSLRRPRVLLGLVTAAAVSLSCFLASRHLLGVTARGVEVFVPLVAHYVVRWSSLGAVAALVALLWLRPAGGWLAGSGRRRLCAFAIVAGGMLLFFRDFFPGGELFVPMTAAAFAIFWLLRREAAVSAVRLLDLGIRRAGLLTGVLTGAWAGLILLFCHISLGGDPLADDSCARFFHALLWSRGLWFLPEPEYRGFVPSAWLVVQNGRMYSQYLPGAILLNFLGLKIGSVSLVFAVLGAGCVWLTYEAGKILFGAAAGLLGAFLLAVSPVPVLLAWLQMDHPLAAFFLMAAFVAGLRNLRAPTLPNAAALGFCLGYAAIMRPLTAFAIGAPLLALWVWQGWSQAKRPWFSWLAASGGGLVPILFMLYVNLKTTGNLFTLGYSLANPAMHSLGFTAGNGHTPIVGLCQQLNNLVSLSFWMFMWPVTSFLFLLILFLSGRASRRDWMLLLPLAGLVSAYFFYPYQDMFLGPRFLAESLPFLALLTARGILFLPEFLVGNAASAESRKSARRVVAALVAALFLNSVPSVLRKACDFGGGAITIRSHRNVVKSYRNDPLATVFCVDPTGDRGTWLLVSSLITRGGAEFFLDCGEKIRGEYMARHPERHYYLMDAGTNHIPLKAPAEDAAPLNLPDRSP